MREGRWGQFKPGIFLYVLPTSPPRNDESEVAQSCPTLCDPVDCSPPGSSVHGILQARILEWVAISFSRGYSRPREWTKVSLIAGRRFNLWATMELDMAKQTLSEKAVAPHSSTLAWRVPCTEEPGGLPSMGSQRVGYDCSDLAAAAAANKPCTFSSTQICTCKKQLTLRTLKWKISKFWKLPLFYPSP